MTDSPIQPASPALALEMMDVTVGSLRDSELIVLDGYDHLDILSRGQHQVATQIRKFLDRLA